MKVTSILAAALAGAQSVAALEYVYLVNSNKGSVISSGMAYFANGPSQGGQPDDYTDVVHGTNIIWEGEEVKGTFGTGVSFTSNIVSDAASKNINAFVGTGTNGYHTFNCYKGTAPGGSPWLLYTVDGWSVYAIYYCIENA